MFSPYRKGPGRTTIHNQRKVTAHVHTQATQLCTFNSHHTLCRPCSLRVRDKNPLFDNTIIRITLRSKLRGTLTKQQRCSRHTRVQQHKSIPIQSSQLNKVQDISLRSQSAFY
jgi:hypothetical protein